MTKMEKKLLRGLDSQYSKIGIRPKEEAQLDSPLVGME